MLGNRALYIAALLCLAPSAKACGLQHQILQNQVLVQIDEAKEKWLDQGIESYRIEVLVVISVWHAQSHAITVEDGKVVDQSASCIPAPTEFGECELRPFDSQDYTVAGLFSQARRVARSDSAEFAVIDFDPTYGFPSRIRFDHPEMIDEDWVWAVSSFEVVDELGGHSKLRAQVDEDKAWRVRSFKVSDWEFEHGELLGHGTDWLPADSIPLVHRQDRAEERSDNVS